MKNSILKPLLLSMLAICIISSSIIFMKKIKLPIISSSNQKEEKSFSDDNIRLKDGTILLSFSDIDTFFRSCCKLVVKDVVSKKDASSMRISGMANIPFSSTFEGRVDPSIKDDKLVAEISSLRVGKVDMPQSLQDKLTQLIQKGFDEKINAKYTPKDVRITNEGMEIDL